MELKFEESELRPLIEQVVVEVLEQIEDRGTRLNGRLGFSESEASALLDVAQHTLRDCRRRGEIHARKVGKQFRYSRDELLRFLKG